MDLATESLEDYLCSKLSWDDEQEILPRVKELTTTVKLLHERDYVHRDIKPQNILVHGELLKLADFGMVEKENTTCEKHGPKYWPTPELLEMCDESVHCSGKRTDVFMLGCIFYFIYTKKYPVGNINIDLIMDEYKMKPIIAKMIDYQQSNRYNCANEVYEQIKAIKF
jgi:serine/threonine protein kinase